MKPIKKIALLHSMCSVGKASITNMTPILSVLGVEVCPLPTILLSTHTGGYGIPAMQKTTAEFIRSCANHYYENGVTFDMIFVGYLGSTEIAEAAEYFVSKFPETIVCVDPIMGDHGTFYSNLGQAYADAYQTLLPYADILLPNLTEGCLLTGRTYIDDMSESEILEICNELKDKGAKHIILTSVPGKEGTKNIALSTKHQSEIFNFKELKNEFHGSGDAFDAVLTGYYLQGMCLKDCIEKAHQFVCSCTMESVKYPYPEREGLLIEKTLSLLV